MSTVLNITNGDCFNEHLLAKFDCVAMPFCEAMMDGKTVSDIYSNKFIYLRAWELKVTHNEYISKMYIHRALLENSFTELHLWFGKDTFCQTNLLTLLAYLEQIAYNGKILLNYIDDETFEVLQSNIPVTLGTYKALYEDILIAKKLPDETFVLAKEAFNLYFDYQSPDGYLQQLMRQNTNLDNIELLHLLLESSKPYGLSDRQATNLILRYRKTDTES